MKRTPILLSLFILLIPSLVVAQTSRSASAAANKSFPKFYAEFRATVNRRDKAALKRMMSSPFNENCTLEGPPATPGKWIEAMNSREWRRLQKLFASGTKPWNSKSRPQRVTTGDPENLQLFEFGADGKWRWLGCACSEC